MQKLIKICLSFISFIIHLDLTRGVGLDNRNTDTPNILSVSTDLEKWDHEKKGSIYGGTKLYIRATAVD